MAKAGKRKLPSREEKPIRERWKIEDAAFDKRTLLCISRAMKEGIIETVDFPISRGKEANVYRASGELGKFAVKIYRKETTRFFNRREYIEGDPRFSRVGSGMHRFAELFARKEYKNLQLVSHLDVPAPRPYFLRENVLIMDYLGDDFGPYPRLSDVRELRDSHHLKDSILDSIFSLASSGIVHADLSPYNILVDGENHYLIDFGEGTVKGHPKFVYFLERDIRNTLSFFRCGKEEISLAFEKARKLAGL